MSLDKARAIQIIEDALEKIPDLRAATPFSPGHVAFVQTTGLQLARIFGRDSPVSMNFSAINYQPTGTFLAHPLNYQAELTRQSMGAYQRGLGLAEGILRSALEVLSEPDAEEILRASRLRAEGAKVFISHGKETPALTRTERFVRTLGLTPLVVVREASEGLAVDDLVERRMRESDCAIILATADDAIEGRRQPRANVIHEIGLAQEMLDNRIVYLKEAGCEFPSNVQPKVWENFTQDDLAPAFEKIVKELRAFGII